MDFLANFEDILKVVAIRKIAKIAIFSFPEEPPDKCHR